MSVFAISLLLSYITLSGMLYLAARQSSSSVIPKEAAFAWPLMFPKCFAAVVILSAVVSRSIVMIGAK
jgi:hypothetical protein